MDKNSRRDTIIKIIEKYEVDTQEEIAQYLLNYGFNCTQATISRDIKELKLVKVKGVEKKQRYALWNKVHRNSVTEEKVVTLLQTFIVSVKNAQNLVVVKTLEGNGSSCGMAIDKLNLKGVLGSIAGDDTLLIVAEDEFSAEDIVDYINKVVGL